MIKWLKDLGHSVGGLYGLLTGLWQKVLDVKTHTLGIFDDLHRLIDGAETIVDDIRNFEINPKWNSRVISAPKVVEHITELYEVPKRIIVDVKDLIKLLREKIQPAEVNLDDVEGLDGVPTKLLRAGEKILGWATLLIDSLITIEGAIADLNDIVDAIRTSLEDLKNLDGLFLSQSSTKKTVDKHFRTRLRS